MAEAGLGYLLEILDGTYKVIGAGRTLDLNLQSDQIDVGSKDGNAWKDSIQGPSSWDISCEHLLVIDDAGYLKLVDSFKNRLAVTVQITRPLDGKVFRGNAAIIQFPHSFPYDDAATIQVSLQGKAQPAKFWEDAA